MSVKIIQTSFIAGEISPALFGRQDDQLLNYGAERITNFIVKKTGTLLKRSGFQFIYDFGDAECRLEEFRFASTQTLILIFSPNKLHFASNRGLVIKDNAPYSIDTPYSLDDLWELSFSQNADVVTITSLRHPPRELRRYGATDWRILEIKTSPDISPPSGFNGYATYPPFKPEDEDDKDPNEGTYDIIKAQYKVTAVDKNGQESEPSSAITVKCNYYITGATVELSWSAVSGAESYRVYRATSGIYGFLGQTESTSLSDTGATPDAAATPPKYKMPFAKQAGGSIVGIQVIDGGEGYYDTSNVQGAIFLAGTPLVFCSYVDGYSAGEVGVQINFLNSSGDIIRTVRVPYAFTTATGQQSNPSEGMSGSWTGMYIPRAEDIKNGVFKVPIDMIPSGIKRIAFSAYNTGDPKYTGASIHNWDVETQWSNNEGSGSDAVEWDGDYLKIATALNARIKNGKWKAVTAGNSAGLNRTATRFAELSGLLKDVQMASTGDELTVYKSVTVPLRITDSQGSGASAEATAVDGVIKTVKIINGGSNYYYPSVTALGAGSGAKFTTTLSKASEVEYPSCSGQFDQRRVFAGSLRNPLKLWMTNAGSPNLMTVHVPLQDDDRIEVVALASDADIIRHVVAMDSLILFTGSSELRVLSQGGALSPRSIGVRAQSYVGANGVAPVVAKNTIVYISARGAHPQALNYAESAGLYLSKDLGVRCAHLFDGKDIMDLAIVKTPEQLLAAVSSSGDLLISNYLPEQDINAWSRIHTDGEITSVCAVAEGIEDSVYVMVKRLINGKYHNYLECMGRMLYSSDEDARCLDSYTEHTFDYPVDNITGLGYLEGKDVVVVGDGKAMGPFKVINGAIKFDQQIKHVVVGLQYISEVVTVPLEHKSPDTIMASRNVSNDIRFRVTYGGNIKCARYPMNAGVSLYECKRDTALEKEQNEDSKVLSTRVDGGWGWQCQVLIRNDDHKPLEIAAVLFDLGYLTGGR